MKLAKQITILAGSLALLAGLVASPLLQSNTSASQPFQPGNIISDNVMGNSRSMSVAQIQQFLNSKAPNCSGSMCLKNYRENNKSAAQILYDIGQTHRINPQVFIATLQKEVGLVTSTAPQSWMYRTAMGFGCPDSTPGVCDSRYFGFTNQMNQAGRFFRAHLDNAPGWFKPHITGWNNILYHPHNNCGTQRVFIENRATAALYSYTPYVPNQAALNAGYGIGNSCSSYGNRNFHLFFNDWFGNPRGEILSASDLTIAAVPYVNENIRVEVTVKNESRSTQSLGTVKVQAIRLTDNRQTDFSIFRNVSLAANESRTFVFNGKLDTEANYKIELVRHDGTRWYGSGAPFEDLGYMKSLHRQEVVTKAPTITSSLELPDQTHQNSPTEATFTVTNNSSSFPVNVGRIKVEGRDSSGQQHDFPSTASDLTLRPGQTYEYSNTSEISTKDEYNFKLMTLQPRGGWSDQRPLSASSDITRQRSLTVKDPATVTASLNMPSVARAGDNITAAFTMKNHSTKPVNVGRTKVEGRDANNRQFDFASTPSNLTLQPGQEYRYTATRSLPAAGSYTFKLMNIRDGHGWSASFPSNESSGVARSQKVDIRPSTTVTKSLEITPSTARPGTPLTASFTLVNHSNKTVNVDRMKVEGRHSDGSQYDFPIHRNLVLRPGQTYVYQASRSLSKTGVYTFKLMNFREGMGWSDSFPMNENSSISRSATVRIQ